MGRLLPFAGLLLMTGSLLWLESLPPRERSRLTSDEAASPGGSFSLVIIDPGHGGADSGTMRGNILEKDLTLDVGRRLERLARAKGFRTVMTRRRDERISLALRAATANREQDCLLVSIHFDEGARPQATGVQTFYATRQIPKTAARSWFSFLQPASRATNIFESQSLAGFVEEALVAETRAFNRGTRAEQFYVVANVRHPAILIEGGFLSNDGDLAKLITEEYRERLASAIAQGLVRFPVLAVGGAVTE